MQPCDPISWQQVAMTLLRKLTAEALGTALLLAIVIGSGIMAERLAGGNVALALLANTLATGAGLLALILLFGPISGAHFNPLVTASAWWFSQINLSTAAWYLVAQIVGAMGGVAAAHGMFDLALFSASLHARTGIAQWWSEAIATFGLLGVIIGTSRRNAASTPYAVAAWIMAAYWFTASTSFANPVVTLARAMSNTFAGIRPQDICGFVLAQVIGAVCAVFLFDWLYCPVLKEHR